MATLKRFNSEMDYGMQMADDALQDLESRINQVYKEAADGVTQKLNTFLERFEAQDVEMRAAVDRGEISQSEYSIWRRNKILRTEQMRGQIESLTNDMVNADKMALGMINDDLVDVYVNGYNFSGFRGEMMAQAAGYNYSSFSIYNADAMRIILTEDPDLIPWMEPDVNIPADMRWNRKHIQNAIAQGILQGDSIPDISKRLLPLVNMDRNAATRTARTSYTAVQNEGRRDATRKIKEAGIPMQEPWMALLADNTRDTHLMLHGTFPNEKGLYGEGIIPTGNLLRFPADPLGDPEQIYNCRCRVNSFLPGIDHSRDDELYEKMMREEFYDDWVGDKNATGVKDYKVDEQRRALERKRQLDSGERESDAARRYRRQQERQGGSIAPAVAPSREIPEAVRMHYDKFEKKYVDAKVEHSLLITENGEILHESTSRRRESVAIGPESLLQHRGAGAYNIHNHTSNELFSVQDLSNYALYGMNGTITMPNGYEYTLFNNNAPLWNIPEELRTAEKGLAGEWGNAIDEINEKWRQMRRDYIDELDALGLSREESRERMHAWEDSHSRIDMQIDWLEQNAEQYGYIFRKRRIL